MLARHIQPVDRPILTRGLVGLWMSGAKDYQDYSGNGNHGTAAGSPVFLSGQYTPYVATNQSQYITIADSASLRFGTGDFSFVGEFETSNVSISSSNQNTIVSKDYTGFEIFIYQGALSAYLGGTISSVGPITVVGNTPYFIALSRISGTCSLSVNAGTPATVTNFSSVSNSGVAITFNRRTGAGEPPSHQTKLGWYRLYNIGLSQTEIAAIYKRAA